MNDMTQGYVEWDNMMAMFLVIIVAGASLLHTYVLIHGIIRRRHGLGVQLLRGVALFLSWFVACSLLAFMIFVVVYDVRCNAELDVMGARFSESEDSITQLLLSPLIGFPHVIAISIPIGLGAVARRVLADSTDNRKKPNEASQDTSLRAVTEN
jgi:hypothetical protein